jgi:hypothetical protein
MPEERPLVEMIEELKGLIPSHTHVAQAILQAHGARCDHYPFDLVMLAAMKRSMCLINGFVSLIPNNYLCAAPLVRLQVDNVLRCSAVFHVANQEDFVRKLLTGTPLNKIKAADGKDMRDTYLIKKLEAEEPGVQKYYDHLCDYVHLSHELLSNLVDGQLL